MDQSIQDILCNAIEIIAESISNEVKPDRTIEAIVVGFADRQTNELTEQDTGYYKLKYQDAYIYASNNNPLVIYPADTAVFVQVINGEMNQSKMIVGPVNSGETSGTLLGTMNSNTEALRGDLTTNYFKKTQNDDQMPEFVENQTYFQKNVNIVSKSKLNIHGDINVTKNDEEQDAGNVNIGRNLVVAEQTNLQGAVQVDAASAFKDDVEIETNLTVGQNITTNLITFDQQQATFVQDDQGYICVKHPEKLEVEQSNLRVATTEFAKTAGTKPNTLQIGGVGTTFKWIYAKRIEYPDFEWVLNDKGEKKGYIVSASCCINGANETDRTDNLTKVKGLNSVTIDAPDFMTECPDIVEITARKSSLKDDAPCIFRWEWVQEKVNNEIKNKIIIYFYAPSDGSVVGIKNRYHLWDNTKGITVSADGKITLTIQGPDLTGLLRASNINIDKQTRQTICFDIFCAKITDEEQTDTTTSNISYDMTQEQYTENKEG